MSRRISGAGAQGQAEPRTNRVEEGSLKPLPVGENGPGQRRNQAEPAGDDQDGIERWMPQVIVRLDKGTHQHRRIMDCVGNGECQRPFQPASREKPGLAGARGQGEREYERREASRESRRANGAREHLASDCEARCRDEEREGRDEEGHPSPF